MGSRRGSTEMMTRHSQPMSRCARRVGRLAASVAMILVGCAGRSEVTNQSIAIDAARASVVAGLKLDLTATATKPDGSRRDATWDVRWSTSDPAIARVAAGGLLTTVAPGSVVITAELDGSSASAGITVIDTRVAFVTAYQGSGDMSSWPGSGGRTGLAGADAACQAAAITAGLPGTFRAWLSDEQDDAYCRVHGLSGKRAVNCGQVTLPKDAGPWVRTDAYPFAPAIDRLLGGEVYAPLRFDERGLPVPDGRWMRSATTLDGTLDPSSDAAPCANWSTSQDSGTVVVFGGVTERTSFGWTWFMGSGCELRSSLACFEIGEGPGPALPPLDTGKRVFLTSVAGPGALAAWPGSGGATGIAAGDAICRSRAQAAGLANAATYKAWLSDATTSAIDHLASDGPWVRLDGARVAATKAELASGALFTSIALTELGEYRGNWRAWTGTGPRGRSSGDHCNGWTDESGSYRGSFGIAGSAGSDWTAYEGAFDCASGTSLYCFED
jgi:hypothetical protein